MTPVWCCGGECGRLNNGVLPQNQHWEQVDAAAATFETTIVRSGFRSIRHACTSPNSSRSNITFASSSQTRVVGVVYIYFVTLPSADTNLVRSSTTDVGPCVFFRQSDSKLYAYVDGTRGASGVTVTTGQWYRVDFDFNINTGGNDTCDIQVDGSACGQATAAGLGAGVTILRCGPAGCTADVIFDDFVISNTGADYPIGAGYIHPFIPTADGTHNVTAGNFCKGSAPGTGITNATTDSYLLVDEVPLDDATPDANDFVTQILNATTEYVEHIFGPAATIPTPTAGPAAVEVCLTHHQNGSGSGASTFKLNDNGTENTILSLTGAGATSTRYARKHYALAPTGGAWTATSGAGNFNNLRHRFGYASDANPDQYFDGALIEAFFTGTAPTGTAPFAQTDWPSPKKTTYPAGLTAWSQDRKPYYTDAMVTGESFFDLPVRRVSPKPPFEYPNLLVTTLAVPFRQTEWPKPEPRIKSVADLQQWLQERKSYYADEPAAGKAATDLPLPRLENKQNVLNWAQSRKQYYTDERTEGTVSVDLPYYPRPLPPVHTFPNALINYEVAVPFAQTDWPLPVRNPALRLNSWTQDRKHYYTDSMTVGKVWDKLPHYPYPHIPVHLFPNVAPFIALSVKPFSQTEWPLPLPRLRSEADLNQWLQERKQYYTDAVNAGSQWTQVPFLRVKPAPPFHPPNILATLLSISLENPFRQTAWPLPTRVPARGFGWTDYFIQDPNPEVVPGRASMSAQTLPLRKKVSQQLQSWIDYFILDPTPVTQIPAGDQSFPRTPTKFASLRPPIYVAPNLLISTLFVPPAAPPFHQTEWPNPAAMRRFSGLTTWTTQRNPTIHVDEFPFGAWTTRPPDRFLYPFDLINWTWSYGGSVADADVPFAQYDWPNPLVPGFPITQRSWVNTVLNSASISTDAMGHNTLPPYLVVYIWERVG